MNLTLINTIGIVLIFVLMIFKDSFLTYFKKKAENLAMKQDIGKLTEITESLKCEIQNKMSFKWQIQKDFLMLLVKIQSYHSTLTFDSDNFDLVNFKKDYYLLLYYINNYKVFIKDMNEIDELILKMNIINNTSSVETFKDFFNSLDKVLRKNT